MARKAKLIIDPEPEHVQPEKIPVSEPAPEPEQVQPEPEFETVQPQTEPAAQTIQPELYKLQANGLPLRKYPIIPELNPAEKRNFCFRRHEEYAKQYNVPIDQVYVVRD